MHPAGSDSSELAGNRVVDGAQADEPASGGQAARATVLRLQNVRNYAEAEFRPAAGTTLVIGHNAAGKSNLLEAIGMFATLSSPRAGHLGVVVRNEANEAAMRLELSTGSALEIRLRGGRTMLKAGGSGASARTFLGRFRAVLFTPEDMDLVRGEPDLRRRLLDEIILQERPGYRGTRQAYERALRQRNRALRHGRGQDARSYDVPLAQAGARMLDARRGLVGRMGPSAAGIYDDLSGRGPLTLHYRDTSKDEHLQGDELTQWLLRRYEEGFGTDLDAATTRVGPHRDDLEISIGGTAAKHYGSRGEQRSATLALRIAQLRLLGGATLLLDDVLSELDADRRRRLFEAVEGAQVVVASADREAIPDGVAVDAEWHVTQGVLRAAG